MRRRGGLRSDVAMTSSRLRIGAWATSGVAVAALLVGCGASDEAPSDFCKSVDALSAAVKQINQTSLSKSSIDAVQTSISTLKTAVTNLADSAESEFSDEVDAVKAAASQLGDDVGTAVKSPSSDNLYAARTSMSGLTNAVNDLDKAASSSC